MQSKQEAFVQAEGYRGARYHVTAEVTKSLSDHVGAGLFGLYGWRSASADLSNSYTDSSPGPAYDEQLFALMGKLPLGLRVGKRWPCWISVAPFAGVGFGKVELYGHGRWQNGPAFGASVDFFVPAAYLGFAAGAYFLPLGAPGQAGGHEDLGAYFFSLVLGADVR